MGFFFFFTLAGSCGLFVPWQPCSTGDHRAAMQGAAGRLRASPSSEMPRGRAQGCVHMWDRFGSVHTGAVTVIPYENEQALKERERDKGWKKPSNAGGGPWGTPALSCPAPEQQQAASVLWPSHVVWQGMGRRKGGGFVVSRPRF